MSLSIFKDLSKPKLLDIILLLKRSSGMAVNEMATALRMSYMGVKQHCVSLEKKDYLTTQLRPKKTGGRPEKLYRLTEKSNGVFPNVACDLVIDLLEAAEIEADTALTEKLLAHHYRQKATRYSTEVKGRTPLEKAQSFAKIRNAEGCVSRCEFSAKEGLRLVEYHSPIAELSTKYPKAAEFENQMIASVLDVSVQRLEQRLDNVVRYEFRLTTKDSVAKSTSNPSES